MTEEEKVIKFYGVLKSYDVAKRKKDFDLFEFVKKNIQKVR